MCEQSIFNLHSPPWSAQLGCGRVSKDSSQRKHACLKNDDFLRFLYKMLLILVSFSAKWDWRSERQTTELGGKDWFFNNSSQLLNQILKHDKLTMTYLKVTFDVDNPTALEKEKPVQSQLPWCQLFVICDEIVMMVMIKGLMFVVTMKAPLRMIVIFQVRLQLFPWLDWDGEGKGRIWEGWESFLSLVGMKLVGWKLTTFTFLLGGALGLKQYGHAGLAEQARHREPCPWGLQDHRLLCHNHALSEGGRRNATSLFRVVLARNIIPSLETTWKWTTFPQDYSLRQPP